MIKQENQPYDIACRVLVLEEEALASSRLALTPLIFQQAFDLCRRCSGRLVVLGIGKSGHIGSKLAATLASTGSPAFFVHAGEAAHGDLGMICRDDVVIVLSYSGTTAEIVNLLPALQRIGCPLLAITGNLTSPLAKQAAAILPVVISKEACQLGLAPTASTTAMLALGDALAIALSEEQGFASEDFALSHPGGALGKRLWLQVKDLMHQGQDLPKVLPGTTLEQALVEMTTKRLGAVLLVSQDNILQGIFTDGDLRRALPNIDLHAPLDPWCTPKPVTITDEALAYNALQLLKEKAIQVLPVTNAAGKVQGIVHLQDILRAGL
jgi:arabinose-5-phosphate isomerase